MESVVNLFIQKNTFNQTSTLLQNPVINLTTSFLHSISLSFQVLYSKIHLLISLPLSFIPFLSPSKHTLSIPSSIEKKERKKKKGKIEFYNRILVEFEEKKKVREKALPTQNTSHPDLIPPKSQQFGGPLLSQMATRTIRSSPNWGPKEKYTSSPAVYKTHHFREQVVEFHSE